MDLWIEKHRRTYSIWFTFVTEINRISQRLMLALAPPKNDWHRLSTSLVFGRVVSHFQAVVLLIERGMMPEARSLLRSLLEATFTVVAIAKNVHVAQEWYDDELLQRKKRVSSFRQLPLALRALHGIDVQTIDAKIVELEAEISKQNAKKLTTEYLAQQAGMLDYYNTLYVLLSSSSHSRIADFEDHIAVDARDNFVGMRWGPDVTGLDDLLYPASELLLTSAQEAATLFDLKLHCDEIRLAWVRYAELHKLLEEQERATSTKA